MTVKSLLVKIGADISEFDKAVDSSQKKLKNLTGGMDKIGKGLTKGVTLPLVGIGVAAFKMSNDFNSAMANVATLIPGNTKRVEELKKEVQDLALKTGKGTKDMAGGLYEVISALGDSSDSMKILETSAKAGRAGLATTLDAVKLLTAVMKGYGDTSSEAAEKAADLAFQTVKLGQTTFPELAQSMGSVIPLAATLKVSQEELFTGFATLTGVTGQANEVSTQFAAIMRAMIKPTDDMQVAIKTLGYESAGTMIQQEGLIGGLRKLMGTTDGTEESVAKLFGRAEALTAVFALSGGQAKVFDDKLKELHKSTGVMNEAFKEQTEGVGKIGFAWDQLKVKLEVTAQRIGDALAPAFAAALKAMDPLINTIQKLVDGFSNLSTPLKTVVLIIGGIAAAAGPALVALAKMAVAIDILRTKAIAANASMGIVGVVLAAIGVATYVTIENLNDAKDAISAVGAAAELSKTPLEEWMGLQLQAGLAGKETAAKLRELIDQHKDMGKVLLEITTDPRYADLLSIWEQVKQKLIEAQIEAGGVGDVVKKTTKTVITLTKEEQEKVTQLRQAALDAYKKSTLTETEYARWAVGEKYRLAREEITQRIAATKEGKEAIVALKKAELAEIHLLEITAAQSVLDARTAFETMARDKEWEIARQRGEAILQFMQTKQELQAGINQITMSGLEYELWALEQEKQAKINAIMNDKLLDDAHKTERIEKLKEFYGLKKDLTEAEASGEIETIQATAQTILGIYGDLWGNVLDGFYKWGEGSMELLDAVGLAFKDTARNAIHAIKDLLASSAAAAIKDIVIQKSKAIAAVIASVMQSIPFPLNLALAGGAIAAVSALFHTKLAEGGLVKKPTFAMIGEAGPELVVPLSKLGAFAGAGAGGGTNVQVSAYFYGNIKTDYSIDEISAKLSDKITASIQRGRR